jgi:hypothetical protein
MSLGAAKTHLWLSEVWFRHLLLAETDGVASKLV